ncbi:nucleotidyl transferase AbiEii/AbiGii toxin family protein [Ancylobacter mangrovi]|uniref:nucleotidyl transferase AbiEii/AbiGii toxin family protein n=1 Tax=Ancylobacter mangrovi TaxID=2972472 RepID=UPI002161278C|nr:nucleotidyl transferase AbiEii/AbiGii toxin family protein [Ancylobacter mangrovi]MCS0501921.1 nucleotidyl transferase AbiEii/AbiGii toxin family protein [Ancylobacter mangrovi]
MPEAKKNIAASVRARLTNLARERGQSLQLLLTRYALERLLYRLSLSPHRERFALKGAMLVTAWFENPFRPTQDVDFLGFGDPDPDAMLALFREVAATQLDDGLVIDITSFRVDQIREELEYGGLRLKADAEIAGARIRLVTDIGFGDAIEPGLQELTLPVLLDLPAPVLRAYRPETVIAEKFQAMVMLGRANSRMKDFYDLWQLSKAYTFDIETMAQAIRATFARRNTEVPTDVPDALTPAFAADPAKKNQWQSFLRGIEAEPIDLAIVLTDLSAFLMPAAQRARE